MHRYRNRTALRALRTGKGVCYDYSLLFAALSRANGIPVQSPGITSGRSKSGHAWPEAYFLLRLGLSTPPGIILRRIRINAPATRIAFKYSADGSSGLKWRYWGDEVDVDKWTVMEPWRERHDMNLITDCGSRRESLMDIHLNIGAAINACRKTKNRRSSCIPSYKYKSGAGRGCPRPGLLP